jgi:hypothetical protein
VIKTTLIKNKTVAAFDSELLAHLEADETTMRQVEKTGRLMGIRNEQGQLYRALGIADFELYLDVMDMLENAGFINELEDQPSKKGYDSIFKRV